MKCREPVLRAGLRVFPVLIAHRKYCRSRSAHGGHAGSLAKYRISSLLNFASKCRVKNEFLSRTEPSNAGFAPALAALEERWERWASSRVRDCCGLRCRGAYASLRLLVPRGVCGRFGA